MPVVANYRYAVVVTLAYLDWHMFLRSRYTGGPAKQARSATGAATVAKDGRLKGSTA